LTKDSIIKATRGGALSETQTQSRYIKGMHMAYIRIHTNNGISDEIVETVRNNGNFLYRKNVY
jgi:hypothetical protein